MLRSLLGYELLSPAALNTLRTDPGVVILDANARHSWLLARVPGARHLDTLEFGSEQLPADRNTTLVFYCSNFFCSKAPRAARRARAMGFERVHVLTSGISGWIGAGLPVEQGVQTQSGDAIPA
ncbi:MAG: rhodanese-like domain-containing protein [Xanthomonadales bacterium]|nr:rhodanese-like domain-containing protein [Xanthomonadales bacterium]